MIPDLYPLGMGISKVGFGGYQAKHDASHREIKKTK